MRSLKLLKTLLLSLPLFLLVSNAFAVTDFNIEVRNSGGDYSSFATVESAFDVNLTDAVVLSHGGITGTIADGASVTGATSGATGTVAHAISDQILIYGVTGTFQSGEQIRVDVSNYVTSSSAPDDGAVVITFYNDFTDGTWAGGTYDSVNTVTLQGDDTDWDGTSSGGIQVTATGWGSFRTENSYMIVKKFVLNCDSEQCVHPRNTVSNGKYYNIIAVGGGFGGYLASGLTCVNCVSINSAGDGLGTDSYATYWDFYNSVSVGATAKGVASNDTYHVKVYGCAVFGSGTADYPGSLTGNNNACSDTTCNYFTNYEASLTMSNELVDGSNGDVHLKSGSNLIDAGNDYSETTGIDYDIDNVTRSGTWDIGADEYVASSMITNTIRGAIIRGAIVY